MVLFLGVDGGGTGCRAAVCDASGRVIGESRGGPSNIASDPDLARRNILEAALAAMPDDADLGGTVAVMGLAGANVAQSVARFREGLPFRHLRIETDAMIGAKGALGEDDGIVAAIGTGSVYAVQRSGVVRQIGGWGLVLGDEGSGAWLGRTILSRCLRSLDGLAPRTELTDMLIAEFGGPDEIVAFARDAQPTEFAAIAPRVSASSDPAAEAVMREADTEVANAINSLQSRPRLPVVFLGGLGPVYAARLAGRWPIAPSRGTALDGALRLARQDA
jgi:glucosamine kinase